MCSILVFPHSSCQRITGFFTWMLYTNSHLTFDISNSIFTQDCLSASCLIRPVVVVTIAQFCDMRWYNQKLMRVMSPLGGDAAVWRWRSGAFYPKICIQNWAHSPSLPFPPLPSPRSRTPWIQLGGLGCVVSSPSGSRRSPAAKRIFDAFWAKIKASGGISFNDFPEK